MIKGRRRCFFSDDSREAELKYYTKYTKNNCFQECIADVVAEKCNCTSLVAPGLKSTQNVDETSLSFILSQVNKEGPYAFLMTECSAQLKRKVSETHLKL